MRNTLEDYLYFFFSILAALYRPALLFGFVYMLFTALGADKGYKVALAVMFYRWAWED